MEVTCLSHSTQLFLLVSLVDTFSRLEAVFIWNSISKFLKYIEKLMGSNVAKKMLHATFAR